MSSGWDIAELRKVVARAPFLIVASRAAHIARSKFVEVPPLDVGRDDEGDGVRALVGLEARLHAGGAAGPHAVTAVEDHPAVDEDDRTDGGATAKG